MNSIPVGKLKIPETLFKVFVKDNPDIAKITLVDAESITVYNPMDFSPIYKFRVIIDLEFKWDFNNLLSPESCAERLNTVFKMMYTDAPDISFSVRKMSTQTRDYLQEFIDIFS
jgi:hypothetical protein